MGFKGALYPQSVLLSNVPTFCSTIRDIISACLTFPSNFNNTIDKLANVSVISVKIER